MVLPALAGGLFAHVGPLSLPWFILVSCMGQCVCYHFLAARTAEAEAEAVAVAVAVGDLQGCQGDAPRGLRLIRRG